MTNLSPKRLSEYEIEILCHNRNKEAGNLKGLKRQHLLVCASCAPIYTVYVKVCSQSSSGILPAIFDARPKHDYKKVATSSPCK